MGALKASLEKRGVAFSGEDGKESAKSKKEDAEAEQPPREERKSHPKRSRSRAAR